MPTSNPSRSEWDDMVEDGIRLLIDDETAAFTVVALKEEMDEKVFEIEGGGRTTYPVYAECEQSDSEMLGFHLRAFAENNDQTLKEAAGLAFHVAKEHFGEEGSFGYEPSNPR